MALFCLLVASVAYGATVLRAGFLNFDDNFFFGPDNPLFRAALLACQEQGVWAGMMMVVDPRHVVADVYLPVATGSLFLDYLWFGGSPLGPHIIALVLHSLAGYALYRWMLAMSIGWRVSFVVAALFLLHPALAESVVWVSSRKDVLCGLFVFLAMRQVARLATATRWQWSLVAIAALGVLAMYSKAVAVVQPLLAVLVCCYTGGFARRWLGPLVLLAVTVPIAMHHQQLAAAAGTMSSGSLLERLPQVPGAYLHYMAQTVWPTDLNVLYPEVKTLEHFREQFWPGLVALTAMVLGAIWAWQRRGMQALAMGLTGFLVALAPFNTAFPASSIAAADRYLYLAIPFAALVAVQLLGRALRQPWVVGGLLALPLVAVTLQRAPAFASSEALWQASVDVDEDNAVAWLNLIDARYGGMLDVAEVRPMAERAAAAARYPEHQLRASMLLAQLALAENRFEAAGAHADAAIEAADSIDRSGRHATVLARQSLVQTLLAAITPYRMGGRHADARAALRRAKELAPDAAQVLAAAVVLSVDELAGQLRQERAAGGTGQLPAEDPRIVAIAEQLEDARRLAGEDAQLDLGAATFHGLCRRRLEALANYRRAMRSAPHLVEGWLGAAEVCIEAQLYAEAEDYARRGILNSSSQAVDPRLRHALARGLAGQGRLEDAIGPLEAYVVRTPRDRDAARLLSSLLMARAIAKLSDPQVAHVELQNLMDRALAVHPQEPRVDIVRARLRRDRGDFAGAIEALDRVRVSLPEYEDAAVMLGDNLRDLGYQRLWSKDDAGAVAVWRRFLDEAPETTPTDAVRMQMGAIWRRAEGAGIEALKAGDSAAAEAAFRRCLLIDPDKHWAAYLLASVLLEQSDADRAELDRLSEAAVAGQLRHGLERSRQVLLRALVLQRSARADEAAELVRGYLAEPDEDAGEPSLQALERLLADLDGR
ncbi:MAG: tetratricopeptide repeat protein [Planctomycetota bacterium]|nr:tetratricopeptide repeat protein [Planctomycetota bacterium]